MPPKLVAGRGALDGYSFPLGCVGHGNPLTICTAQLSSERRCLLCERRGHFPLPMRWRGRSEFQDRPGPSVQVLPSALPSLPWLAVAFVDGEFVDGRVPIIGARDADEAIDLALARAAQLAPRAKLERVALDTWWAGRLPIFANAAASRAERWGTFNG